MQKALGLFRLVLLGAEHIARDAEPLDPCGVLGAELLLKLLAQSLRECRAFSVGGDGDLQVAALDDRAVVEMAVFDVVHGVAEQAALVGFLKHLLIHRALRGGCDNQKCAVQVFAFKTFWAPIDLPITYPLAKLWIDLRSHDANFGAGIQQAGNFIGGDGASADNQNAAAFEFQECGKKRHVSLLYREGFGRRARHAARRRVHLRREAREFLRWSAARKIREECRRAGLLPRKPEARG